MVKKRRNAPVGPGPRCCDGKNYWRGQFIFWKYTDERTIGFRFARDEFRKRAYTLPSDQQVTENEAVTNLHLWVEFNVVATVRPG